MAGTLSNVSLILFVASGVLFVAAVLIFVVLRIPLVISDLSGRTARKAIEKMRTANTKKVSVKDEPFDKEYKKEKQKEEKLKAIKEKELQEKKQAKKKSLKEKLSIRNEYAETGLIDENKRSGPPMAAETVLLESNETESLESEETVSLEQTEEKTDSRERRGVAMQMIDEITFVDSEETIE